MQAAWFTQPSFDEWSPFGASKKVVTQEKTDDQTLYLTKDTQGNLGQTAVKAEASWFTGDDTSVDVPWTKIDTETVVDHQAVPDKTVYITKDADGTFSETGDVGQASWINTADKTVDLAVWQQMVDEQGNPLVRIVEDKKAVPSDTEYYVHAAKPTSKLGESNWTTDKPAGWTFVDDRTIADTKATPAVTTEKKVVDKAAWVEQVRTPAVYGECALASTGANDTWGVAGLGLLALGLGGGAITIGAMRRARHRRDDA